MKLKLIVSLLSIVGMSACSTSTIVENRSCDRNEDFPWHKTWNQNCSSADNSNGNSSEYSSLRELNSSANDISGSVTNGAVNADPAADTSGSGAGGANAGPATDTSGSGAGGANAGPATDTSGSGAGGANAGPATDTSGSGAGGDAGAGPGAAGPGAAGPGAAGGGDAGVGPGAAGGGDAGAGPGAAGGGDAGAGPGAAGGDTTGGPTTPGKEEGLNPEPNKPESDNDENIEGNGLEQDL